MTKTATVHAQQKWEYMEVTRKTERFLLKRSKRRGAAWMGAGFPRHTDTADRGKNLGPPSSSGPTSRTLGRTMERMRVPMRRPNRT